ncbi:hypothetical protein [Aeromonas sobria]|uniref:hypothetical protein n=1 Tax=Aeromonas sobria TaxID=646 RepID=UPI000C6D6CF7|nr:hypothetical protein [Aeromonas sobria]PKQ78094.1 hypothetical protein CJF47_07380 [Aeromonas sobria]
MNNDYENKKLESVYENKISQMPKRQKVGRKQAIPCNEQLRIRGLYMSGEYTLKALAEVYEVSTETIRRVLGRGEK